MKNVEYIKKYSLGEYAEIGFRNIDKKDVQDNFLMDLYFDYKSLLEYTILKSELNFTRYDNTYTQMVQKLDSLGKRTPFDLPTIFYSKLDEYYYMFMKEYCKDYYDKLNWIENAKINELEEFLKDYGVFSWNLKNRLKESLKFPKIVYIAMENLDFKIKEQRRIEEERERKAYQQQREQYRKNPFNNYSFFGNYFFNFEELLHRMYQSQVPNESFQKLGLSIECSVDDVKKMYRQLSLVHHPDKGGNSEKFIELTEAKEKCLSYLENK
jgi:hypothetical protein